MGFDWPVGPLGISKEGVLMMSIIVLLHGILLSIVCCVEAAPKNSRNQRYELKRYHRSLRCFYVPSQELQLDV